MPSVTRKPSVRPRKRKEVKIKWLSSKPHMSQIYNAGLEYCFVSEDNRQVCPMVFCKDFLQDAIWAWYNNRIAQIYGFKYSRKTGVPLCLTQTRIALANSSDVKFSDKIPRMLEFVNAYERKLRLMRTTAVKVSNTPKRYKSGVWLLKSSSRWMLAPPMVSLYSLLLRVGFNHKQGQKIETTVKRLLNGDDEPYQRNDRSFFESAQDGIDYILKHGYIRVFYRKPENNYPKSIEVNDLHESAGIVAFSTKIKQKQSRRRNAAELSYYCYAADIPHWYRNIKARKKKNAEEK